LALTGQFEEAAAAFRTTSYRTPRIHLALIFVYDRLEQLERTREELRCYERLTTIPAETMISQTVRHPEISVLLRAAVARARAVSGAGNQ
jgi:hypothetical protein